MKVVNWNCNGGLRNKTAVLDLLDADLLVIQECEDPARSAQGYLDWAGNYVWHGKDKNKGIGIFARKGHRVEALDWKGEYTLQLLDAGRKITWVSEQLECFLPCLVNGTHTVLGAWTKQAKSPNFQYIGQFWLYLQMHKAKLSQLNTLICADLNSNTIWDEWDRLWNHSDVVDELSVLGLKSVYHTIRKEAQGKETQPTFYLHRNLAKPFHIDYVFASQDLLNSCSLEATESSFWLSYSDHLPMIVTIDDV
jgi:exodeoxyribonuclease-3